MRKNRRRSTKMSVATHRSFYVGSVIMVLFVAVIVNVFAKSSCDIVSKSIGSKERRIEQLEKDLERETARWDEMKTDEKLDQMLAKHGLKMHYPRPEQYVRMRPDGKPYEGQYSLAAAKRVSQPVVAKNTAVPRRRTARR